MPHDIVNGHVGHNHSHDHLHSHMPDADKADELMVLTTQFIDGFVGAKDKMSYLRIAGVPLEIDSVSGGPKMKLVDIQLTTEWQVGTASPSFGSQELSYLPYPGEMVTERTNMGLVYVSLKTKQVVDLRTFLGHHTASDKENR
ncbi:MAG: hypothetical protein R8G34_07655 [Paracoccaceae bacterium]|nr:hypothetical protein [Paracoccaceae bacterium]